MYTWQNINQKEQLRFLFFEFYTRFVMSCFDEDSRARGLRDLYSPPPSTFL